MKAVFTFLLEGAASNKVELDYKIRLDISQWGVFILYIGFILSVRNITTTLICMHVSHLFGICIFGSIF